MLEIRFTAIYFYLFFSSPEPEAQGELL